MNKILRFRSIIKQSSCTSRFIVQRKKYIEQVIFLFAFNGNIVFSETSLHVFLQAFNAKWTTKPITTITTFICPTLENYWLCSFTNAEGCFTCSLLHNTNAYCPFRYILAQLPDNNIAILRHLTALIGGIVRPYSEKGVYQLRRAVAVNGVGNIKDIHFSTDMLMIKKATYYQIRRQVYESMWISFTIFSRWAVSKSSNNQKCVIYSS